MIFEHKLIKCPNCSSTSIIFDDSHGEYVCIKCGLVLDERAIDHGREWRSFNDKSNGSRARTGVPLTNAIHDRGICTTFNPSEFRSGTLRVKARRLIRVQKKIRVGRKDRVMEIGLEYLNKYASKLDLPGYVREEASRLLRRAISDTSMRKRSIASMAAASIYLACKQYNLPMTLRSISKALGMAEKDLWNAEKKLIELARALPSVQQDPVLYIPKLIKDLNLDQKTYSIAMDIVKASRGVDLSVGRGPIGLAAAIVYMASILSDERRTQQEVASLCNVSDVTIRNRYGDLVDKLDIVVSL